MKIFNYDVHTELRLNNLKTPSNPRFLLIAFDLLCKSNEENKPDRLM